MEDTGKLSIWDKDNPLVSTNPFRAAVRKGVPLFFASPFFEHFFLPPLSFCLSPALYYAESAFYFDQKGGTPMDADFRLLSQMKRGGRGHRMLCSEILPQHPAILPLPPPGNPRRGGPHPRDLCPVLRLPGPIQALRQSGQLSLCHCREPVPGPLPAAVGTPPCRPARTGGPPAGHPGHPPGPAGRLSRPKPPEIQPTAVLFSSRNASSGNRQMLTSVSPWSSTVSAKPESSWRSFSERRRLDETSPL